MSDNVVFKKISEYPSVEELSTDQKETYLNSAQILSIGSTSVGADLTNYRIPLSDIGGGSSSDLPPITPSDEGKFLKVESGAAAWGEGSSGDDSVTINIGDVFDSMPADTGMWDKIAEPLFNDKTLHIVASFGGSPIEVKLTETTSIKMIKENFPQIATFADLKQFIEQSGYSRYVVFVLSADISGAGFTARVDYSTGFAPDKLLGINPLTKAWLMSADDGTKHLVITMMCGYYKLDTSDNIWNFIQSEFFVEKDEEDPSIVEPLAIVNATNKKNFDVMYVGEMGALTDATAGNTIYSTNDSEEREWLPGNVNITTTNISGKDICRMTVRVNGLASKCDANGFQLPDTPQVPIMWRGTFEWGFKNGLYCYRCTDEQLVALSQAQ